MKANIATAVKWIITVAAASVMAFVIIAVSVKMGKSEPAMPRSAAEASEMPKVSCIAFNDDYANAHCYSMETGKLVDNDRVAAN